MLLSITKKGFTLIELLGIMILISIIGVISTIVVEGIIKSSRQSLLEKQINKIEEVANEWIISPDGIYPTTTNNVYLPLSELVEKKYFEGSKVVNPVTEEEMNGCIVISLVNNKLKYEYVDETCESIES